MLARAVRVWCLAICTRCADTINGSTDQRMLTERGVLYKIVRHSGSSSSWHKRVSCTEEMRVVLRRNWCFLCSDERGVPSWGLVMREISTMPCFGVLWVCPCGGGESGGQPCGTTVRYALVDE